MEVELKVWVEGLERVVCGLTESTTCQETIYALAHATAKTGRFVLVEEWRGTERSLSPSERPLELLRRRGSEAVEVRFVLKCLDDLPPQPTVVPSPSSHYAAPPSPYEMAASRPVAMAGTLRGPPPPVHSPAYSTGSLPRLRQPQRPPIPNYQRVRVPVEPDSSSLASSATDSTLTRHPRPHILPRNVSAPSSHQGSSSVYASLGASPSTTMPTRRPQPPRSISASAKRRPPPPSYNEALNRLEAMKGAATTVTAAKEMNLSTASEPSRRLPLTPSTPPAHSNSIDAPSPSGPGYNLPASRQQLQAMIAHQERQLRAQIQRMGLCDQKLEALANPVPPPSNGASEAEEAELNRLEAELTRLRVELGPLRDQGLEAQVEAVEASVAGIKAEAADLRAKTEAAEEGLAAKQGEIAALEAELERLAGEELSTAEDVSEESLAAVTAQADALEAAIAESEALAEALTKGLNASRDSLPSLHNVSMEKEEAKRPGLWV